MANKGKKLRFLRAVMNGLNHTSNFISGGIVPAILDGAENVIKNIDEKIIIAEKRIMRKVYTFMITGIGIIFLIFAFFFHLKDFLHLSNTLAFLSIGIVIFVVGLMLQIGGFTK